VTTTALQAFAFVEKLEALAEDVGRLRRRLVSDEYGTFIVDRIGLAVDGLDAFLHSTAAELVARGVDVETALARVDARATRLQGLLGEAKR